MLFKKILIPVAIFACLQAIAQNDQRVGIDALAGQFIKHIRSDQKEKIIVFTDKMFYASGETIWLKAWCIDSLSDRFIFKSKNLYVDLVDDNDSVISQVLLDIPARKTEAKILLPAALKEGYYWLRGYTSNILREDPNRIFVKPLYVLNSNEPNPRSLSKYTPKPASDGEDTSAPRIIFFPEGGSIISGASASIVFRCTNAKGNPVDVSGYVTDTRKDTVVRFRTSLPGIGKFSFDAFNPRKYTAHISWKNNRDLAFPLPAINQFASQLSLIDQNDQSFHIRVSLGDSLYKKNKTTNILGVSRDSLCFAANGNDMYDVTIPKSNFPPGKATLFLFDEQNRIVSQRNIYVTNSDTIRINASTDKSTYGPREKAKLNIVAINNTNNLPERALLVVSVTEDQFGRQKSDYLKEGTEQFFQGSSAANQKQYSPDQVDLVLQAQKSLYTDWKYGDENKAPAAANDDSDLLSIRGRITNKKDEPLKNYIVNLFSKRDGTFKIDTTRNNGTFLIRLPDYDEGTEFNLKLTNLKGQGQEGKVILDKFDFPQFKTPTASKKGFDQTELTAIKEFRIHQLQDTSYYSMKNGLLNPVTVSGEKKSAVNYDASKRVSQFSDIITSDKINGGDINSLTNAVESVPGFTHSGISSLSAGSAGVQPLVVLDGETLSLSGDVRSFLQSFDATNIDFVEILKGPAAAMYGMQGAGGVILINTTNVRKQVSQINEKGISTIYPKGYAPQVDFPVPDYDKKDVKKSSEPDRRSTIYWNGHLLTDEKGNASVTFFTADLRTSFFIFITGITQSGDIFSKNLKITQTE